MNKVCFSSWERLFFYWGNLGDTGILLDLPLTYSSYKKRLYYLE